MMSTEPSAKPVGCTNFKLRRLMRRVAQHYDGAMSRAGLKSTQYSLLSNVIRLGPVKPGELARELGMDASTMTRNLQPLLEAGWVAMLPGTDGRSRLIEITESGRAKRQEAQRHWKRAQQELNALLGTERVLQLHALIDESLDLLSPPADDNDS